ncbi:MAG: hypothetical protein ABI217_11550 [Chthoniobacterales bacterium]
MTACVFRGYSRWDFHLIKTWDLASIAIGFAVAVSVFLICALVGPKASDEGAIDLEEFFWRQRPYFYGALLATFVLSLFFNLDYLKTGNIALFFRQNLTVLPMLIPTVFALLSRRRWIQWVAGVCVLAMVLGYTIEFYSTLN